MAEVLIRGMRHHVQRLGAGPPTVVFLHGVVMDNLSSWYFSVAPAVAAVAPVLLYDLRGHGRSERPAAGYDLDSLVADLAALLDAGEALEPVHLVGNSMGGMLALAFARAHPERVQSLVLVDAHLPDGRFGAQMGRTLRLQGRERDEQIQLQFADWLGRHSERKRNRLAQTAAALVEGTSLVADLEATAAWSDARLAEVRCPVLAIYGEASDIRDRGERLGRVLPDCRLVWMEGCAHSVLWEATERVRGEIVAWVSEQQAG